MVQFRFRVDGESGKSRSSGQVDDGEVKFGASEGLQVFIDHADLESPLWIEFRRRKIAGTQVGRNSGVGGDETMGLLI